MSLTIMPAEKISTPDYYAGGMMHMDQNRSEKLISVPGLRAVIEDDFEALTYQIDLETGRLTNQVAAILRERKNLELAYAGFITLTNSAAPREQIEQAAKQFRQAQDAVSDLIWDTEAL